MTSGCDDAEWTSSVSLEPMVKEDVEAVRAIDEISFPSAWSVGSYLRDLRNSNSYYIVARLTGRIIGYGGMWVVEDEAHISTLAVHPDRRRHGLGRRLLSHLMEAARGRGVKRVTLEVRAPNSAARRLYESFGFQIVGLIPRYYGDTGEDAIVMHRHLSEEEGQEAAAEEGS